MLPARTSATKARSCVMLSRRSGSNAVPPTWRVPVARWARQARARSTTSSPAAVGTIPSGRRSNSTSPISFSSFRMPCVSAGWLSPTAPAAALMLPCSCTAVRPRKWRRFSWKAACAAPGCASGGDCAWFMVAKEEEAGQAPL
jgi:hypothetical protein